MVWLGSQQRTRRSTECPAEARRRRVQGIVVLEAVIGPAGRITDVTVLRSTRLLDDAALEAVRQWEYTPTLLDGVHTAAS